MEHITSAIIGEARKLIGVRFRHQGRNPSHGVDCLGLIMCVAKTLDLTGRQGIKIHDCDKRTYSKIPDKTLLYEELAAHLIQKNISQLSLGDIVVMEFDNNPQHLAIISNYTKTQLGCIHAYAPLGKVVEHRLDMVWKQKISHIFALCNQQ